MYCKNCGKELVDGLDECPFCHCKVDNVNNSQNLQREYKKKNVFKVLKIISLIWLCLGLITLISNFITGGSTIWLSSMIILVSMSPWQF